MFQTMTNKHTDLHPERKITEFKGFFSLKTRIFYVNPALLWIFMARLMGVKLPPKNPILHKSHTVHRTKHIFAFLSSDMIFFFFVARRSHVSGIVFPQQLWVRRVPMTCISGAPRLELEFDDYWVWQIYAADSVIENH